MNSDKKISYIFLSIIALLLLVSSVYFNFMLNTKGRYKIATYIGSTKGGREGGSDYFSFRYNDKYYKQGIQTIRNKIPKYVFCKFVPTNPNLCKILFDDVVPYCLLTVSTPKNGWDSIPQINCNDTHKVIYSNWIQLKD